MTQRQRTSRLESVQLRDVELPVACRACPLRRLPIFRHCSARELNFVAGMKRRQIAIAAGSELPQSAKGGPLYTVYEGWATRTHKLADGSKQILDFVLPGDIIGLSAALLGSSGYIIEAITAITLCELDHKRLPALLQGHPALALGMLETCVLEQERADRRLSSVGRMGAAQRIAYLMLDLRHRLIQRGTDNERALPFPLQRSQIADAVGLSKVHAMRALKQLKQLGLAVIESRKLVIPNATKLARFCNYAPLREPAERRLLL
jgi:CRP/FNR family transcriptional regulator, anaerobic regulatory protein